MVQKGDGSERKEGGTVEKDSVVERNESSRGGGWKILGFGVVWFWLITSGT